MDNLTAFFLRQRHTILAESLKNEYLEQVPPHFYRLLKLNLEIEFEPLFENPRISIMNDIT